MCCDLTLTIGQVNISDTLDRSEADVRGVVHVNGEPSKKEHDDAALMMQRVHREKQAKKHVEELREVARIYFTLSLSSYYNKLLVLPHLVSYSSFISCLSD